MRVLAILVFLSLAGAAHAQVSVSAFTAITPGARVSDLAVRDDGGLVVVGSVGAAADTDFDGDGTPDLTGQASGTNYVARYDASGGLLWVGAIGATSGDPGDLLGVERVALGADGTVYVGGVFTTTLDLDGDGTPDLLSPDDGPDLFAASYTSDGSLRWGWKAGSGEGGSAFSVSGLAVDGNRLLVAATFAAPLDFDGDGTPEAEPEQAPRGNGIVLAFGLGGAVQGLWRLAGREVRLGALVRRAAGGFAVGGHFSGSVDIDDDGTPDESAESDTHQDAFVAAFGATGALTWSRAARTVDSGSESVSAMTTDVSGRLYVGFLRFTGGALDLDEDGAGDTDGSSALIGAYEADGMLRWGRPVEGLLPIISRLAIASSTLYAGGLLAIPFEASDGMNYVAPFALDGTLLGNGVYRIGVEASAGTTTRGLVATGAGGEVVVAGRFNGAVDFDGDGTPETADGTRGTYMFRSGLLPVTAEPPPASGVRLSVAANPSARPLVTLALAAPAPVRVSVVDVLGREVAVLHEGPLAAEASWRVPPLASGSYRVRVVTPEAVGSRSLVVMR